MEWLQAVERNVKAKVKKIQGVDTDGSEYTSLGQLWRKVLRPAANGSNSSEEDPNGLWYTKANEYWDAESNCPCTDDGVLGGYGVITPVDIQGSREFLESLRATLGFEMRNAADCGAGIGRITKNLLLPMFQHVDLVEQSPRLLAAAPAYIGVPPDSDRLSYLRIGLQDFAPPAGSYDVIWVQWVIGHLHDADFISFLRRCTAGLTEKGVLILKDNVITDPGQTFMLDLTDNSVCRQEAYLNTLLEMAGMQVLASTVQQGFPDELYPVHMIALRQRA